MRFERVGYLAAVVALMVAFAVPVTAAQEQRPVAACMEDVVLVGAGNFEHGYWEWYECGPALDDFEPWANDEELFTYELPALTPPPTDTAP